MTAPKAGPRRWLVLAAAGVEVAALRRRAAEAGADLEIRVVGVGARADVAAAAALVGEPGIVLNLGFAGGLAPVARPGDLVRTTHWVAPERPHSTVARADPAASERLHERLATAIELVSGPGVTVDAPFHDDARGAAIHAATGALTVEMEGARWARLAEAAGWGFVALRVISDRADLRLARPRHELLTASGRVRPLVFLGALRGRPTAIPAEWRALRRAQADWKRALASLDRLAEVLAGRLDQ